MLKVSTRKFVELQDWNNFVREVYGKPYNLQQQDGCMGRGTFNITIPSQYAENYPDASYYGVSFDTWLNTTDEQLAEKIAPYTDTLLHWHRKFYPSPEILANDLFNRGLIEAGEYSINIDW